MLNSEHHPEIVSLGRVPAKCRFIRRATLVEYAQDRECLFMFETADGQHIWLPRDRLPDEVLD